ncbi:MAG TPA: response regulator transcription factor [Terriglobales bacterium]|nr:response regulator transcription factor [Terriglobales bacterium]
MRILVVEDEPKIGRVLLEGLEAEQFAVDLAVDGESGLELATQVEYDAIILDLNLPRLDGFTVLQRIRKQRLQVPVLILSARADTADRVRGLNMGADDYLRKPFSFDELVARVHALLRRPHQLLDSLSVADLEIDRIRHVVTRAGKPIPLTQREYALLVEYLMRNAGRPVTRTMVVEHVWNLGFEGLTNIVDVYINYLRGKVDSGFNKNLIHTVRGIGYVLADHDADMAATAQCSVPAHGAADLDLRSAQLVAGA